MSTKDRVVYFNRRMIPEGEARISIYDSALMFGDMVFEMMRTYAGKHFMLREHLERLYASIRTVRIPIQLTRDEMEEAFHATIEANAGAFDATDEIRSLINVSRGPLPLYRHIFDGKLEPTVVIACFPLKWIIGPSAWVFDTGVHAVVPSQRAIPGSLLDPKVKNRSRLFYQMANLEASMVDAKAWALLLDPDGFVAEGTGANFFVVKDGVLFTPEPRNCLRGISRHYTLTVLAKQLGLDCVERNLELYDAINADEAFFTCTPQAVVPCTKINGVVLGGGRPGEITLRLLQQWGKNVGIDIAAQARAYRNEVQA